MEHSYSRQNGLTWPCFHGSPNISFAAIPYWINSSRMDTKLNPLDDHYDNSNIWRCGGTVCPFRFQDKRGLLLCWLYNTSQTRSGFPIYEGCYTWHIWSLVFYMKKLNVPISNNFCIREHCVITTTRWNSTHSMLTLAKLLVGYLVVGITRELDKKPSLYWSSIYIIDSWSMLQQ